VHGAWKLTLAAATDGEHAVKYADVAACLATFKEWNEGHGKNEQFHGAFSTHFALHDKRALDQLRRAWGSWPGSWAGSWPSDQAGLGPGGHWCMGKAQETKPGYNLHHPLNKPVSHFSWFYQPVDEIRDYFGVS
jgi:hypothetical protein